MVSAFGVWKLFEENVGGVTATSTCHVHVLQTFVQPKLQQLDGKIWFEGDGGIAHTPPISFQVLNEMFPSRIISHRGYVSWPPRSPDLAPADLFLWGYLIENCIATTNLLKEAIRNVRVEDRVDAKKKGRSRDPCRSNISSEDMCVLHEDGIATTSLYYPCRIRVWCYFIGTDTELYISHTFGDDKNELVNTATQ
ncbi:hypothetical protein Trydic_g3214 [Trypoxylus dichotomus]